MFSPTLCTYLTYWSGRWPDRVAIKSAAGTLTWGELDRNSRAIAAALIERGMEKGDRVGILMHNRIEFIEAIFGSLRAGAIVTLLNIRNTAMEMRYPVEDAGLGVIFTEPCFHDTLSACLRAGLEFQTFTSDGGSDFTPMSVLRETAAAVTREDELHRDDTAFICYTSGTTGQPKGAMISHGGMLDASSARTVATGITFEDRVLLTLPMAYTGGLCTYLRDAFVPGGTLLLEAPSDPERLLDVIVNDRVSLWPGVPIMFEKVVELPRFKSADLSYLKHVVIGGAMVSLHLIEAFAKVGVGVTQGYGLTESSGSYVSILGAEDAARKIGSAGKPVVNTRVRVVDDEGNDVPAGVAGEILVSGPTVMKGYFNKPEETAKAIVNGWLHSGDMGVLDDEGYLKIVDRKKDMLISGGLNVYPAEIERVLAGITGMEEFLVIGVPDPKWGEVPMIVAHSDGELDLETLLERCTEYLADYKRPKYFFNYGKPLPRTYSGKLLKRGVQETIEGVPSGALELDHRKRLAS